MRERHFHVYKEAPVFRPDYRLKVQHPAMCALTMEEEHAVSTARDGPLRPNMNDRRPAATDRTLPGRMKALSSEPQGRTWSWMSAGRAAPVS